MAESVIRIVLLVYLVILMVLYFTQARLIFPGHLRQGTRWAKVDPTPGIEILNLKDASGETIAALFGGALTSDGRPDPGAAHRPTLLFFYGNGNCTNDYSDLMERFRRLGANVLIPDYLGYGMSQGKPSESGCFTTAETVYRYLLERKGIDPRKIVAVGYSLGGAVAIDLAANHPLAGLATFSTFTSMGEMAGRSYPFLPVSLLLRHPFRSDEKMARIHCPILLAHGTRDAIVPFSMMDRLAKAAGGPVEELPIEGAGHNDFFEVGDGKLFAALRAFLQPLSR